MADNVAVPIQSARLRVVLSFAAGLLAEVLTIITVGIVVLASRLFARGQSPEQVRDLGMRTVMIVGPLFGAIFTFFLALWVVRRAKGRYMAHALLVAAGAIVLHVLGALGAPGGFRPIYVVADLLKVIVAVAAALIGGRRTVPVTTT